MTKFWRGVFVLVAVAFILLAFGDVASEDDSRINFTDLETECRSGGPVADYRVMSDNSLRFTGRFAESNTRAQLDYEYSVTDERIALNIVSEAESLENFQDDCLASVIYSAETPPVDEGRYVIDIQHNGETARKQIVRID